MANEKQDVHFENVVGHLVKPERPNGAGIVILPTIFGLNAVIRGIADAFANLGFTALLWDHYAGEAPKTEHVQAVAMSRNLTDGPAVADMQKCVTYLMETQRQKSVGAIGYCLGGRYIFMLGARERRLGAAVAVYPSIEVPNHPNQSDDAVALAAEVRAPVMLAYPGKDEVTSKDTFHKLQQRLQSRPQPSITLLYPEADHGFLWRPGDHNKKAAAHAQPLIDTFFKTWLT